jgi:hypothetical protein
LLEGDSLNGALHLDRLRRRLRRRLRHLPQRLRVRKPIQTRKSFSYRCKREQTDVP